MTHRFIQRFGTRFGALLLLGLAIPTVGLLPTSTAIAQVSTDPHQLLHDGINALNQGNYPLALQRLQLSLSLYRRAGDRLYEGVVYSWLGSVYDEMGRYDDAIAALEQALAISRAVEDRVGEGVALNQIGLIHQRRGNDAEALDAYEQALAIFQETAETEGEAATLNNIASIYDRRGDYADALNTYEQALVRYRQLGRRSSEANTLKGMGVVHYNQANYGQALDLYQQALTIQTAIGDRREIASTLNNIGAVHADLGDYAAAFEAYTHALEVRQALGDRAGTATTLNNIALLQAAQGNYAAAQEGYNQSLAIAQDMGDRHSEGIVLTNLGNLSTTLGQFDLALTYHQQALTLRQTLDDRVGISSTLNNMGRVYYQQGHYDEALSAYRQSLAISQTINTPDREASTLVNIGAVYDNLGDFETSLQHYQDALEIFQNLGTPGLESATLNNIGYVYRLQGNYDQAISTYEAALAIAQTIGDRSGAATTLSNLGIVQLWGQNFEAAEENLLAAIAILTSLRSQDLSDDAKISLFDTQAATYKALQQLYVAQNQPQRALEISEQGRTRAFVDLLTTRLDSDSEQTSPAIAASNAPDIESIRRIAAQHQATLVEYSWVDRCTLYIWVVQPDGTVDFRQAGELDETVPVSQAVATASSQARSACVRRGVGVIAAEELEDADDSALQTLHQILIDPIADLLPTDPDDHIIFIPHEELFLVPFPALQSPSGRYLIEDHTLLTAPSIQVLDLTAQRQAAIAQASSVQPAGARPLIVGNPTMPSLESPLSSRAEPLAPLPGAEAEANAIAALLDTTAITGQQATESFIKAQLETAPIVHLATHGLLDYGVTATSDGVTIPGAIALAPSTTEDGLLTAREILGLSTQADLVVLSACDTGLGTITGDGVVGLARAWIAAGTPSLVVSLWLVPDAPTAILMTEFYRQQQSGLDKAQALRQAMLHTMASNPEPRDWAAFTLIGEAQ
ncbi:MAG: CHAT domain-containing tetratricopeptide repeat protein [Cyanobacteria bacterium J06635_15]